MNVSGFEYHSTTDTTVDTSFGGAFRYGFDMPLENIAGTMEDFFGVDGSGLRNAIETNPNYRPASADFINPPEGAFTVGGYAPGYLPRTVAENIGQYGAALGLRLAGASAGGAIVQPCSRCWYNCWRRDRWI